MTEVKGEKIHKQEFLKHTTETAKEVVQAMAIGTGTRASTEHRNAANGMGPKVCGPSIKQPNFDCNAIDKYTELKNFEMEVNNIFLIFSYNVSDLEKVPIMKNRQDR